MDREFAPDLFGEIKSHVLAILRRAMNVVEEFRNFTLEARAQLAGDREVSETRADTAARSKRKPSA